MTQFLHLSSIEQKDQSTLIGRAYDDYHNVVFNYLRRRVNVASDVEDLTQDVFVRLLEYAGQLRENTLKYFVFTVARSVLFDHLRRLYRHRDVLSDTLPETLSANNELENAIIAEDLARMEQREIGRLSPQRKTIYLLYRFSEHDTSDIAGELALSKRTVENHIFAARKTIRSAMRRHCS